MLRKQIHKLEMQLRTSAPLHAATTGDPRVLTKRIYQGARLKHNGAGEHHGQGRGEILCVEEKGGRHYILSKQLYILQHAGVRQEHCDSDHFNMSSVRQPGTSPNQQQGQFQSNNLIL